MKVEEESEKVGLKCNIQKSMASSPITSWQTMETVTDLIFSGSKIAADGECSHEIKRCLEWFLFFLNLPRLALWPRMWSILEPVSCSMSSSNCCFLTCIQISQEAGQVVWYSQLLKNFPHFVLIYTVKGFGIINKAEIDVFLKFSCFFDDPADVGNLISGSSAFFKSSLNIWKFMVHVLLKPGLENFEHYFVSVWDECDCVVVWAFFGTAFLWDWNEKLLFHCCFFQICWHMECSTFTASSFRIWDSSTGIPSPPLALFVVMLPKAHFTSHSRMSGSRWVITPLWLSGSWRSFLYNSCGSDGKASAYNVGDPGLIPGSRRSSGEGNGNPLQYCCLENPMDGIAW